MFHYTLLTPVVLMAMKRMIIALFFTLALARAELSTRQLLKGSVICLDCGFQADLSGIQVLVKCNKVKKLAVAYTEEDGSFQTELPSDEPQPSDPSKCMAKIMGGPFKLYTPTKNTLSPIIAKSQYFTISKPFNFYRSCPLKGKCGTKDMGFASSKTVDLPLPKEWGLPPTSYYVPFIPIIGIP